MMGDLELAYKDQGYHEMEFSSGNESELHERKKHCQKNPGHLEFIPAKQFTMEHLPEYWRDSYVFDTVTAMMSLTVRLAVGYTSKDRPPDYPLYNRRGQYGVTAFGSGWVWEIFREFTEKDDKTCPCETCKQSPHLAKTQWGEFAVWTATHVVFDTSEARHTKCNLFFDSDEDRFTCPSLQGVKVVRSDIEKDICWLTFITHEENVSNKLVEMFHYHLDVRRRVPDKYKRSGQMDRKNTAVVISHPHGLSKHVTVGEMIYTVKNFGEKWKYSAETCMGSSGGTICILKGLGDHRGLPGFQRATHSGCRQKGQNESTTD